MYIFDNVVRELSILLHTMYMYSCFSLLLIQCSKQKKNKNNLNVAKCTLGKVNLTAMLVSSFPNSAGGGQPDAFSRGTLWLV